MIKSDAFVEMLLGGHDPDYGGFRNGNTNNGMHKENMRYCYDGEFSPIGGQTIGGPNKSPNYWEDAF